MATTDTRHVYAKVVGDLLHPGHIRFFRSARAQGTHLTVCVVPDERVKAYKGVAPIMSLDERMEMVAACRWVDEVICDGPKEVTQEFMTRNGFRIYAFGASGESELKSKLADCRDLPEDMRVVIPYEFGISTTALRERILSRAHEGGVAPSHEPRATWM